MPFSAAGTGYRCFHGRGALLRGQHPAALVGSPALLTHRLLQPGARDAHQPGASDVLQPGARDLPRASAGVPRAEAHAWAHAGAHAKAHAGALAAWTC